MGQQKVTFGAALLCALLVPAAAFAQQMPASGGDSEYIAKVGTAAPAAVVKSATIVQMQANGSMRTLQKGTNGFTCMVTPGVADNTPMCADQNAMMWAQALATHGTPPSTTGFIYMLAGDSGASNTDPYASAATPTNHWVKTGPHVMIVGPSVKTMGYPATLDPDPAKPYVMWPGSPFAHLMIPVSNPQP